MTRSLLTKTIDLRQELARALQEPLDGITIQEMSLSSRCALIRRVLDAKYKAPVQEADMGAISLRRLGNSFEISDSFHEWQDTRRDRLRAALKTKEAASVLDTFRHWARSDINIRKQALWRAASIHQRVYMEGIYERLPLSMRFKEGGVLRSKYGLTLVFASFSGDLRSGQGRITHYMHDGGMLSDARDAFNSNHHEVTHFLHHHLAVAYHRNHLDHSHPLYHEAKYFHALQVRGATIPAERYQAYLAQPHEAFAHQEGDKISAMIESLAM